MVKRQRTLLRDLARALRSYLNGRPVPDKARDALRRYGEQFPEPGSAVNALPAPPDPAEEAAAHRKAQPVNQVNQVNKVTTVTAAVPRHHVCPCGTSH